MAARKYPERKAHATRNVTIRLHGWPAYDRALSGHHEACWFVDIVFQKEGVNSTQSLTYFQSADYQEAKRKYEALEIITK